MPQNGESNKDAQGINGVYVGIMNILNREGKGTIQLKGQIKSLLISLTKAGIY